MFIVILIVILIVLFIIFRRSKKMSFDSIVMINGCVGSGKSLLSVKIACSSINKAHGIWWRRTHIYSKIFRKMKNEEEPLLYSNIPVKSKFYVPLDNDILRRKKRMNYHSVMLIDESSLIATSLDYKDKDLSEDLSLFLKLVRHSVRGSYRNLLGSYPNVVINTQSKNDNHYAFDRCINQVLFLTKSMNIPFFKVVWCRDLLLIDSVQNEFDDDIKESLATRWYLIPKKFFKKYDSFAYEFLTRDKEVVNQIEDYKNVIIKGIEKFYIPSFHNWKEITSSNVSINDFKIKFYIKEVSDNES